MFSDGEIASQIEAGFEPVWQGLRAVPTVTIDFGNGNLVRRTLRGNIATYVCTKAGQVVDILPGIYEPRVFAAKLEQLQLLAKHLSQSREINKELIEYHRRSVRALKLGLEPGIYKENKLDSRLLNLMKTKIESRTIAPFIIRERDQLPLKRLQVLMRNFISPQDDPVPPQFKSAHDQDNWNLLASDTQANETLRRRQIHEKLMGLVDLAPAQITKWLYKEVLHADLDDPYLGLGEKLFANYPFSEEDALN